MHGYINVNQNTNFQKAAFDGTNGMAQKSLETQRLTAIIVSINLFIYYRWARIG
jgi:hypothetical protein